MQLQKSKYFDLSGKICNIIPNIGDKFIYAVDIPIEGTPEIGDSVMVRATVHDARLSEPLKMEAMMPVLEGRKGKSANER